MKSKENSSLNKELMVTSLYNIRKSLKDKNIENISYKKPIKIPIKLKNNEINDGTTINLSKSSSLYFPKLNNTISNKRNNSSKLETYYSNYKKHKKPKIEISLKKMESFIRPINKHVLEINKLNEIKENLIKKRFNELHNYKLQINPNNYYHNYGLNEFIEITNNNTKKNKSLDYQYNNISSYNNIILKKEDNKHNTSRGKTKIYRNIGTNISKNSSHLLTSVPLTLKNKNKKGHNYIIININEENDFFNTNSIWRFKNINDIINNKTNLNFFKNFIKNSRYMGKLKTT
jgi:hypothetical protein